ncbi:hypothetical protein [uncultured Kordia sp.]|uniref:hypothetical protein n=1 Tax=uncultured Kordia sp. TaxID=507699 RepID=UPI00261CE737|nr:hypothetical protein [uncultured Kordia sp.]
MGLDIFLQTEIELERNNLDNFETQSLSREFCNLMCRKDVVDHEPELDQIGKLVDVDISCFYQMNMYPDDEYIAESIEFAKSEAEKETILANAAASRKAITGNITTVLQTLNALLEKLSSIDNLPSLLLPTDFDTLNNAYYFSDFMQDKGKGYIDNNFGQDLRNFKRFVEAALASGNKTIWFSYG